MRIEWCYYSSIFLFHTHLLIYSFLDDGVFRSVRRECILLTCRAQKILAPKRVDLSNVHTNEAVANPRDSEHRDRPFVMTVAENVLCWEHMKPYIEKFSQLHLYDNMLLFDMILMTRYSPSYDGREYFKKSVAHFLSTKVFKVPVTPDTIIAVDGSGAVMDIMGAALLNPNDAFICMLGEAW